jgi:hypothetical protein
MYNGRRDGGGAEAITPPSHANMEKVGDHIKVMCYMHRSKGPGWHMSTKTSCNTCTKMSVLYLFRHSGTFCARSVEIEVFPSPTACMLISFSFRVSIEGIFCKFIQNDWQYASSFEL